MAGRMKKITAVAILIMIITSLTGCDERQVTRVSYNVSKEADNFNVTRRLTVINTRTDLLSQF